MAVSKPLTIGVDATTWWNNRGFGRFTRGQLGAMLADPRGHRFVLFVDQEPTEEMRQSHIEVVRVRTSSTVTASAVANGSRQLSDILAFRRAALAVSLDVLWFPAVYSWYPVGGGVPTIITFHDAIAERFTSLVLPALRGRLFWNLKVWLAKRSAKHVVTVSKAARDEIIRYLRISPEMITVILEAADDRFTPVTDSRALRSAREQARVPADRRLILYVGGLAPHKNLAGLIKGFAEAIVDSQGLSDVDLVLAGDPGGAGFHSNVAELHSLVAELGVQERVHFPGYVPDDILPALYSAAMMVAMPAFSEGFGLPAAEAIACGTPVIASSGGAVEEVVGPAGLFFDPHDPGSIALVIGELAGVKSRLQQLRRECLPRAASMSWAHSASSMLDVIEAHAKSRD